MVTYHKDLSPYDNNGKKYPRILSVGWLDAIHPFPQGNVSQGILDKLLLLTCESIADINLTSMTVRSFELCPFTDKRIELSVPDSNKTCLVGMSELCIPSKDKKVLFCFPDMLYHYIVNHKYLPPDIFLESLESFSITEPFDIHAKEVRKYYWQIDLKS